MKWVVLDFSSLHDIERQIDEVVRTHDALVKQQHQKKGNTAQIAKALEVLRSSILQRIHMMERFYQENDLDPRSARVEACRLKLKRLLKAVGVEPSMVGTATAVGPSSGAGGGASTSRGERKSLADMAAEGFSKPKAFGGGTSPTTAPADTPLAAAESGKKVTLKIQFTHSEYEQLRLRRETMRELKGGSGSQAWENAFKGALTNKGATAKQQGMHTMHEVPYKDGQGNGSTTARQDDRSRRVSEADFRTTGKPDPMVDPGFISTGPYVSANSDVVSRTLRFGGTKDNKPAGAGGSSLHATPFDATTPRTRTTTSIHKMAPLGTM